MKLVKTHQNIPDGWKKVRLKDVAFINKRVLTNKTSNDYLFRYIDLSMVNNGLVDLPTQSVTYGKASPRARRIMQKGDVLMSTVRPNLLGHCMVNFNPDGFICSTGFAVIENIKDLLNNKFWFACLFSNNLRNQINNILVGSNYPALNSADVANLSFTLPPLPEQNRIVAVLETWDKAIENLENKIKVKKKIKQGLMQEILTGRRRLSGYSDKWKTAYLGDICKIGTGKNDVNQGNPLGKYPFFTCAKKHTFSDSYSFDTEAILIAGNGEVGNCQYYKGKFEAYQRTYVLSEFKETVLYLYSYLQHFLQKSINSQKQMGAMPYIKLGTLKKFVIQLPNKDEQLEIANVLRSSNEEIVHIEKQLLRLTEQKKYLLNNLITGEIRMLEN